MSHEIAPEKERNDKPVIFAIFGVIVLYLALLTVYKGAFFPKHHEEPEAQPAATETVADEAAPADKVVGDDDQEPFATATPVPAAEEQANAETPAAEQQTDAVAPVTEEKAAEKEAGSIMPPYWMIIPFAALLLAIAIFPLVPFTEHWWESNLHRFEVAAVLGFLTLLYYAFMCDFPVECEWSFFHGEYEPTGGFQWKIAWAIFCNAFFNDFIPFIVLLFALFTIAGGIRISGDLKATPIVNTTIMGIGAVLASFIGTTGAAMLLIRLLLNTNKQRKHVAHTVIFFIFCVCNCGGCLLPIGDPPLFLGYLRGVPFMWTFGLWKEWLFVNGLLLAIYFLWDSFIAYPKETGLDIVMDKVDVVPLKISGLWPNGLLLLGIVLCVALLDPSKAVPGTNFVPPAYMREVCQLALVALSLMLGSKQVRIENEFNYGAILEVAALFFGIFICMQVPLQILNVKGGEMGFSATDTHKFYWATGSLSSVLDNAPTYVVFYNTGKAVCKEEAHALPGKIAAASGDDKAKLEKELDALNTTIVKGTEAGGGVGIIASLLAAVSLGAVFMGAMTYIGNGPNFMVKAIAEQSGVKMPSFFGYMAYSVCILVPIFLAMTYIFL
ncbi:MAG: sodium:proton antiporter [Thermoguttaceae bacterium]|nr:sodium:proton antiporter [Thermoguttaceae bacterium]